MDGVTTYSDPVVNAYIESLDDATAADTHVLIDLMQRISGAEPKLWNQGTIGFGTYHYKYGTGREGDALVIGFYPRKNKITVYVMDGTHRYSDLLAKLGKHAITGYCLYIKQLADVDLSVLEQILRESNAYITALAAAGPIDHILWKPEEAKS
jgi:hypothetical protein